MEELLIFIFLLLGPFLDVSVFYNLPFNLIVRGLFLGSIVILLLIRKKNSKYLIPLLIFSIIEFIYQYSYLDYSFITSLSNIFRFLYLPVSLLYFKDYEFRKYKKENILFIILGSYIAIYLLSYVFNIGSSAYDITDGKTGYRGVFNSINEFSAILVSIVPIVAMYLSNKEKYCFVFSIFILSFICSVLLGTKVLFVGLILVILYYFYTNRRSIFTNKSKYVLLIVFIIGISYLFTKTNVYENMLVQKNFFKVDNIFSYDYLNKVLFNNRLSFLVDNFSYFRRLDIIKLLLGMGINDATVKMVEIDLFDIIFRYGIIGIVIFVLPFISLKYKSLKKEYKLSLILLLLISLTSGHVLVYPNVSIYIALLFSKGD